MGYKELLFYAGIAVAALGTIAALAIGVRALSDATVFDSVISPAPGIQCYRMTTESGVAVSCWKQPVETAGGQR